MLNLSVEDELRENSKKNLILPKDWNIIYAIDCWLDKNFWPVISILTPLAIGAIIFFIWYLNYIINSPKPL